MTTNKADAIYEYDKWQVRENQFKVENNKHSETVFALGNGYLGIRGNYEEGYSQNTMDGTYINGFYETSEIEYGESAYGYPKTGQTLLNITDSKIIKLYVDGEEFNMKQEQISEYERTLNFKTGLLTRKLIWENSQGKQVELKINRLVSFKNRNLLLINYNLRAVNFSGTVKLVSTIDGDVSNYSAEGDPRAEQQIKGQPLQVLSSEQTEDYALIKQQVKNSKLDLVCGMKNELRGAKEYTTTLKEREKSLTEVFTAEAEQNQWLTLNKYVIYYTNFDQSDDLISSTKEDLEMASNKGFSYWLEQEQDYLNQFWQTSDIEIEGDIALQQGIRFNQFHLLQSVGRDGRSNIAAKGLTGEGYEGHYFWDTEIYILPFFLYNRPEIARKLLEYRYSILDNARERARDLAHQQGALFPWRTINGNECSAYYPAGTAQYHINADIVYALKKYVTATDDLEFLVDYGAEIAFETARVWYDLGHFNPRLAGQFCIDGVTGPDEYTAIVDNNCYTNYMAQLNLEYAAEVAQLLQRDYPKKYNDLVEKIDLEAKEIDNWQKAADKMYLPYDQELGIHPQDDKFLAKQVWDFANTPKENYPLLLNYHPLVIYRHQVCKQADLLLALYLLGDKFNLADKKRDFNYYDQITTHDSSLSTCIYSIIASEIGYHKQAYDYFMETVRMDLDNKHNNSDHGVHTASMAGSWHGIVAGFAGFRDYDTGLYFKPYLPQKWASYQFKLTIRGCLLEVEVKSEDVTYRLLEGRRLKFYHHQQEIELEAGQSKRLKI